MIADVETQDPLPAAKLGMWFFLASEAMFFVGMLGSFVVLESTSGQHALFVKSTAMLSPFIGIASAMLLLISSLSIKTRSKGMRWAPLICSVMFLSCQIIQWRVLLNDHTYAMRKGGSVAILDGDIRLFDKPNLLRNVRQSDSTLVGDIHTLVRSDIGSAPGEVNEVGVFHGDIIQDLTYGPSRNNFFGCYFLFTSVHCLHLFAGMIALLWFILKSPAPGLGTQERPFGTAATRGNALPASLQIYWHFVNTVGVISLAVLYFV